MVATWPAAAGEEEVSPNQVRDREDALASTRDACAPQNSRELQQFRVEIDLRHEFHEFPRRNFPTRFLADRYRKISEKFV
jgi:hypothetical protein